MNASSPESLWVHRTPWWHFDAATPLPSSISRDLIVPITVGLPNRVATAGGMAFVDCIEHAEKNAIVAKADMTKHQILAIVFFDILHSTCSITHEHTHRFVTYFTGSLRRVI